MSLSTKWSNFVLQCYSIVPVPQRVVLSLFGFMAIVNAYAMRFCLDLALSCMAKRRTEPVSKAQKRQLLRQRLQCSNVTKLMPKAALAANFTYAVLDSKDTKYDWSNQLQTFILTSFSLGYVVSHIPGGQLAEKYGGKWVLAVSIVSAAILTLLTPLAIRLGGPVGLIIIRILVGLSEGPIFPALCTLMAHWVPAKERGKLGVLVLSGGQLGIFLTNLMSTLMLQRFSWSLLFYFFGVSAVLWFVCFAIFCYNDPESSPYIRETEKQYLETEISSHNRVAVAPTPWREIFKNVPMWAFIWATIQYDWTQAQTQARTQVQAASMAEQQKKRTLSLSESMHASLSACLPNMLNWLVSLLSGVLSDFLINRNILSTTMTRKVMAAIAAIGPNILMNFRSCLACSKRQDMAAVFNCAIAVMGTYYAGIKLTPLDMSPNYAGTLMAIANSMGSFTALLAPYLEEDALQRVFQAPFNELRAVLWLACTFLITGEIQEFNDPLAVAANKNR